MMNMRNLLIGALVLASTGAFAAGGGEGLDHIEINVHDKAAAQRGAALFVNYCLGCHSAQYMRYNRLQEDLDLTEEQIENNLLFGDREISDPMMSAMDPEDAEEWLGVAPPDLTLTARSRGTDWLYTFMRSFYMTENGWNNTVLENASMPHVLVELQGVQELAGDEHGDGAEASDDAGGHGGGSKFELVEEGAMTPAEYDAAIEDLVTYMAYMAEPARLKRESVGIWVLLFLVVFTFLAWLLYHEYWKDVK